LEALTKPALQRVAGQLHIEDPATMSKPQLISAIAHEDGVSVDALTKDDLLRLGRSGGAEVHPSMTKPELIAAISESATAGGRTAGS
jgi:hypothetical protein